jgi:hypothetical protein
MKFGRTPIPISSPRAVKSLSGAGVARHVRRTDAGGTEDRGDEQLLDLVEDAVVMVTPDFDGDPEYAPMWAGESCGAVNDVKPTGTMVRDLVREAEAALADSAQPT